VYIIKNAPFGGGGPVMQERENIVSHFSRDMDMEVTRFSQFY